MQDQLKNVECLRLDSLALLWPIGAELPPNFVRAEGAQSARGLGPSAPPIAEGSKESPGSNVENESGGSRPQVEQIYSTEYAYAAKLKNGKVVTWGDPEYGGDSSKVQDQLKDVESPGSRPQVEQIYSTMYAFAAKLKNGKVVTWGHHTYGGLSNNILSVRRLRVLLN